MAYKITATVQTSNQEPCKVTMFRDNKVTEAEIKEIYKGATVDNYSCEKVV